MSISIFQLLSFLAVLIILTHSVNIIKHKYKNIMKKQNPRRANGARRDAIRRRALAYYDTCYICGQPIDKSLKTPHPMGAEVDEIIPVSRGGSPYEWSNIRLTHRRCNRIKSTHSIDYARAKVNGTPQSPQEKIHFKTSQW